MPFSACTANDERPTLGALAEKYRRSFADLLHVYSGLDVTAEDPTVRTKAAASILFNPVYGGTQMGDRVVVTGSDPALGARDPAKGLVAETQADPRHAHRSRRGVER